MPALRKLHINLVLDNVVDKFLEELYSPSIPTERINTLIRLSKDFDEPKLFQKYPALLANQNEIARQSQPLELRVLCLSCGGERDFTCSDCRTELIARYSLTISERLGETGVKVRMMPS